MGNDKNYAPWVQKYGLAFPYGECQCGCGEDAPVAKVTRADRGWLKGHPTRFINRHDKRWQPADGPRAAWMDKHGLQAPYGKCQCGCGENAPIAKESSPKRFGTKRGEPQRYVVGHWPKPPSQIKYKTLMEAFDAQVSRGAPDQCWDAHKVQDKRGYGRVHFRDNRYKAHRVAYILFVGPIPPGKEVCHKCDRRRCANPNHLFLGTHDDNMQDMVRKGRSANKHTKRKRKARGQGNE